MKPALILIDLQNDFLHPNFLLGKTKSHLLAFQHNHHLIRNVSTLILSFRRRQLPIIWVRSEYLKRESPLPPKHISRPEGEKYHDVPLNPEFLAGSHHGERPFCLPGSEGADVYPDLKRFMNAGDTDITKSYYSSFTYTRLDDILRTQLDVDTLFFAGLTANNCVRATVTDAFFLGYDTYIVGNAIGATSQKLLDNSLTIMSQHYGKVLRHHQDIDSILTDPSLPTLYFVNGSIPSWRVQLLLAEKRIAYNPKRLLVMSTPKETRTPEFKTINPRCKTPTFVDVDGTTVIESLAILQYLETYHTTPSLNLTPDPKDKAKYTTFLKRFHETENLHNVCEGLEYVFPYLSSSPTSPSSVTDGHHITEITSSYSNTLTELEFWENYTQSYPFVAGDSFTSADCAFWPILGYLEHRGLDLEAERWKGLKSYAERIKARGAQVEAMPLGWDKKGKVSLFDTARKLKEKWEGETGVESTK